MAFRFGFQVSIPCSDFSIWFEVHFRYIFQVLALTFEIAYSNFKYGFKLLGLKYGILVGISNCGFRFGFQYFDFCFSPQNYINVYLSILKFQMSVSNMGSKIQISYINFRFEFQVLLSGLEFRFWIQAFISCCCFGFQFLELYSNYGFHILAFK